MKEHGILFSTEMVKAILEDRKTQTRRVIKLQPASPVMQTIELYQGIIRDSGQGMKPIKCPYGQVGDGLWVRETFRWEDGATYDEYVSDAGWQYKADVTDKWADADLLKWKPSIHMPRWASRITLEITDIRVERLQEITKEDAKAEGIEEILEYPNEETNKSLRSVGAEEIHHPYPIGYTNYRFREDKRYKYFSCPNGNEFYMGGNAARDSYYSLWDSINGKKHPWESNPWVWVVGFKRRK